LDPREKKSLKVEENCIMRSFLASTDVIRMMQSKRLRLAGHRERMGIRGMHTGF
jgi:hypothetical protein